MTRYADLPPFPERIAPPRRARRKSLVELAVQPSQGVSRSRLPALARDRAQPRRDAVARLARAPRADVARPGFPEHLRRRASTGSTPRAPRSNTWMARRFPDLQNADHRVLLGRVRHPPVAADLRGRPRRARGRSLQGSQRPRRAAGRRRLHVSAGVLPPDMSPPEGWQQEATSGSNWPDVAIEQALKPDGRPASSRCRSATARC